MKVTQSETKEHGGGYRDGGEMRVNTEVVLDRSELTRAVLKFIEETSGGDVGPPSMRPDMFELEVFADGSGVKARWKEDRP